MITPTSSVLSHTHDEKSNDRMLISEAQEKEGSFWAGFLISQGVKVLKSFRVGNIGIIA